MDDQGHYDTYTCASSESCFLKEIWVYGHAQIYDVLTFFNPMLFATN